MPRRKKSAEPIEVSAKPEVTDPRIEKVKLSMSRYRTFDLWKAACFRGKGADKYKEVFDSVEHSPK